MEIRLLYENELQWAVNTANEVFEYCVRPFLNAQEIVQQYQSYVTVEHLWQQLSAGRLFLWGAFENGQMCAVSAMQDVGHITMLYVRPYCQRRHIGAQMLDCMSNYAASVLHKDRVTVNVMPVTAAPYFYHVGYTLIQGSPLNGTYVSLERRIWSVPQGYAGGQVYAGVQGYAGGQVYGTMPYGAVNMGIPQYASIPVKPEVKYTIKKVSAKLIISLTTGVLVFSVLVIAGITLLHR